MATIKLCVVIDKMKLSSTQLEPSLLTTEDRRSTDTEAECVKAKSLQHVIPVLCSLRANFFILTYFFLRSSTKFPSDFHKNSIL